LILISKR